MLGAVGLDVRHSHELSSADLLERLGMAWGDATTANDAKTHRGFM
jgi:hypothetical protein